MAEGWMPRKPPTPTVHKQPQVHKPAPPQPAPQLANDDFNDELVEEDANSLAPTQQLPSLADRLRQLRGAWANSGASTRSASNDLDIEDDDPPLTTRSLRKNKASDKGREKDEPPTKKARIENDADEIEMYNEEAQTGSGLIIKSFFGSLRGSESSKKQQRQQNNDRQSRFTVRDYDSDERDDDIEQADQDQDETDKRDTSFLKGLVSSLKVLPFYNHNDPVDTREFPRSSARRLLFVEPQDKKEVKQEAKEEIEEDVEDDMNTQKQRGRLLPTRGSMPSSQTSDQSQSSSKSFRSNNLSINNNNNNSNKNYNYNRNHNNDNTNIRNNNLALHSQADHFLRSRNNRDDVTSSQEGGNLTRNFKALMRGVEEEVEDIADVGDSFTPAQHIKKELPDEEIQERDTTSWLDGEKDSIRTKMLYSSPTHPSTAPPRNNWVDNFASSTQQATQPVTSSGSSPKFVRNGLTEKLVRVMRQHFIQHQHLYQHPSSTQTQTQQQSLAEKLQVVILHDLSKIQPHVNVVLSILRTPEDFAATADASADAEIDVTHDNYEFLRTHEAVLTVYSVAAAEEMQLGLGSVVTLEHWQEIKLPGIERRVFLSLKAHRSGTAPIDPADPSFASLVSQLRRQNQSSVPASTSTPSASSGSGNKISVAPVYPLVVLQDTPQEDTSPDSPSPQASPPKPKAATLDQLHPLLQNFTIEAVVQCCFFREFSTNNSTSNNSSTCTNNSYKNPTNNTKNTNTNKALIIPSKGVMNLCEIMKQRMTLSQRTADTPNVDSQDSTFPIRSCSVILQDDSGATAELVVPDEYASQWKELFIEGEGLRFVLENLQVLRKEVVSSDSPLNSLLSPLRSRSHVLLTVVKNSTFRRIWDADDVTLDSNNNIVDTPHVGYCPEPLVDVKTLLDASQLVAPRVSIMGKIVHIDQQRHSGSLMNATFCTLNIFDGSVDSTFGVNNIGVFVRGVPLTSLLSSRLLAVGSVVRIRNAIFTASAPLLGTDHYTTFERIRLPHSPSTKASLSSTTTPSSSKSSSTKVPSSMAKPHPITPPSLVSDPNSKMPVPTQAHSLIYHNELARLLEVPFSDHDRLARLEAEADFAEISSENIFAVRKRYRYCLMSMRGKIEHQLNEKRYNGCAACFHEVQSSPLMSDSNDGVNFCTKCSEVQPAIPCVDGTFGVSIGKGLEATLNLQHDQICTLLRSLPHPTDLSKHLRELDAKTNNKNPKNSNKPNTNNDKFTLSKLLNLHKIYVPCICSDGDSFTCVSVKGASLYLM